MTGRTNDTHSLHPNSVEAERALLGGLMQRPTALREIDLSADDLWRDDHKHLFRLLREMLVGGEHIDLITVPERVMRTEEAGKYGGLSYVIELPDHAPSTVNLDHYARIIREKSEHRRIMQIGNEAVTRASRQGESPAAVAAWVVTQMRAIGGSARAEWVSLADAMQNAEAEITERQMRDGQREGLTTGSALLDDMFSGLKGGRLYVIGGRPAMGKTGLALQMAESCAADPLGKGAVGIFSMEMDADELGERTLVGEAKLAAGATRRELTADEWDSIYDARPRLAGLPVFIQDRPSRTVADIVSAAHKLEATAGSVRAIMIDYLQLMDGEGATQNLRIAAISKALKALARDMDVPVVLLSQLSRDCDKRPKDKRPLLSDLRDSGGIEQDADVVMFVYRHEVYYPGMDQGVAEVIVRKQRKGPIGVVKLQWHAGRFIDLSGSSVW